MSSDRATVSIVKGALFESPFEYSEKDLRTVREMIERSLDLIGGLRQAIGSAGTVVVKPNLVEVPFEGTAGSVVTDARVALAAGEIHAMHDPTEGGVATGLLELATASGVGLEVFAEQLVVSEDSRRLCAAFDLDPLGVISSGALLIGCAPASTPAITGALEDAGIPCARIGRTCPSDVGLHVRAANGARTDLPRFAVDEIARLFANSQD